MGTTPTQQVTAVLPLFSEHLPSRDFINDLVEALKQIRLKELHSIVVIAPCATDALRLQLAPLEGVVSVTVLETPEHSMSSDIWEMVAEWCVKHGTDVIFIQRESTVAPNTLSELCCVAALDLSFSILTPRSNLTPYTGVEARSDTPISCDHAFMDFLDLSPTLSRWQVIRRPHAGCVYIRTPVLREHLPITTRYNSFAGYLLHLARQCRRNGNLCIQVNSAYHFAQPALIDANILLTESDRDRIQSKFADESEGNTDASATPSERRDLFLTSRKRIKKGGPTLLLDLSDLSEDFSAVAELGKYFASALREKGTWSITVMCSDRGRDVHKLNDHFLGAKLISLETVPEQEPLHFDAALRLGPPRSLNHLEMLARMAPYNFFLMTDCLTPKRSDSDTEYGSNLGLLALTERCADGLIFIGSSALEQFHRHLPTSTSAPCLSVLPSLYAKEYSRESSTAATSNVPTVVVMGCEDQPPIRSSVVNQIARVCQKSHFKVVGFSREETPSIETFAVSATTGDSAAALCASADVVVFPWLSEGLSLFLIRALVAGKVVIAMRSPLLDEISRSWTGSGAIIATDSIDELVNHTRKMSDVAERYDYLKIVGSSRTQRATAWRWGGIESLITTMMTGAIERDPQMKKSEERLGLLTAATAAMQSERTFLHSEHSREVKRLTAALQAQEKTLKELQSAQTLLLTSSSYQIGKVCANALQAIPGLRSKSAKP